MTSTFFAATGPIVGIIVAALGIYVALWPPSAPRWRKLVGWSVAALSLLAVFTEIHNKQLEEARTATTDKKLEALNVAATEARKLSNELSKQNKQLQVGNEHLSAQLQVIESKPGAVEAGQMKGLREDIGKHLEAIAKFSQERQKEDRAEERSQKHRSAEERLIFQSTTAALYATNLCADTLQLLIRAAELKVIETPQISCSIQGAYTSVSWPGFHELQKVYQRLPM